MIRLATLTSAAAVVAVAFGGCGSERHELPPAASQPAARQPKQVRAPQAGLELELPRNMTVTRDVARPGVFRAALGEGFVSAFAYRRAEQIPRTAGELETARRRLQRTVIEREPGYRLERSGVTELDGSRAVELVGRQTFSRRRLQIRSLHVFKGSAEYVLEVAAPVTQFERFDAAVTPLIRQTLDVTGAVGRSG